MRAYPSSANPGWAIGLEGASKTLGGYAQGKRQQDLLEQRKAEEERRAAAQGIAVELQRQRAEAQGAERQAQFQEAQFALQQQSQQLFDSLGGGPPSPDQDARAQRLAGFAQRLKNPAAAEGVLEDVRQMEQIQATVESLRGMTQEILAPMEMVQDPGTQQQLQMIAQTAESLTQQIESGAVPPDRAPGLMDNLMESQRQVMKAHNEKMTDMQVKEAGVQQLDQARQAFSPDTPQFSELTMLQQDLMTGQASPKDVQARRLEITEGVKVMTPEIEAELQAARGASMIPGLGTQARDQADMAAKLSQIQKAIQSGNKALFKRLINANPDLVEALRGTGR